MAIVAAEESRVGQRDVYVPRMNSAWAHRSCPSSAWEIGASGRDGRGSPLAALPPGFHGLTLAWSPGSPSGSPVNFTTNAVGGNHI
jgi:hypothetical protein